MKKIPSIEIPKSRLKECEELPLVDGSYEAVMVVDMQDEEFWGFLAGWWKNGRVWMYPAHPAPTIGTWWTAPCPGFFRVIVIK